MKVAYNNCFGGFGLSPKAMSKYAQKKGITLTWYNQVGYEHDGTEEYHRIDNIDLAPNSLFLHSLTEDLGAVIYSLPEGTYYYESFYGDKLRCDPNLISIIEEMGDEASGSCADLQIEEIPDGAAFEITEYDGNEQVVPPRMSW